MELEYISYVVQLYPVFRSHASASITQKEQHWSCDSCHLRHFEKKIEQIYL